MADYYWKTNPASLGMVIQTDHTAAPVSLMSGVVSAVGSNQAFNSLSIQAVKVADLTANTGKIYIGQFDMNISSGVGVIKTLAPGEIWTITAGTWGNKFHPEQLWLQAASDNDGAQVAGIIA